MIKTVSFSNYKAFSGNETIEVKPITLIIGKNSSGKSSILKLFPMLARMLDVCSQEPLYLNNYGISLGAEYMDIFHKRQTTGLKIGVELNDSLSIEAEYYIDANKVKIATIKTQFGENVAERDLNSDKTDVRGLIDVAYFKDCKISPHICKPSLDYIGPFRVQAPQSITFQGFDDELRVGYKGGGAYNMLLNSYRSDKNLFNLVSDWMGENLEGQKLKFSNVSNNNGTFSLMVERDGFDINVTGVGQGIAQVLPVIVQSFVAKKESINVMEQPVLHLHPAAHANVAERLGLSAIEKQCSYVIESHSENMLLGFRRLVADRNSNFTKDDIAIYYVDKDEDGAFLKKITINENGDLSEWPTGVFSESFELLREINRMRI